ncbi:malto-oligosyltrehalose synthase [Mycolicibacterium bacteremicum]|uniref:Malto-oligosyltrehalose synthase n=1 Tax=Mycolicibacterium bacteremicum TaxID=564198 RepID=A0A1W9Z3Z1_MYCBA|nr:malto-oligosyltrehalose synthase [Mycolicibacterium bacteremicum]MCV7433932.1 malto-oligosyltrehalose synthase [Mycolicibacterium bacteremicum]ORA07056.1 malto-oligosyltrehalose synthase [Mycolicibacterium bacteremicum]
MGVPLSTYRLQMRGDAFTFAEAVDLLDYLDDLGVSHLYLSPILTAAEGSTHGYDVTDPTSVSAALGGPEGLAALAAGARERGLGLIVDIVPNHVGVDDPATNPWWWDVLTHGRDSRYSSYFDIDWDLAGGRVVLPVLGSDDDVADLSIDGEVLRLGDRTWPIAPGTGEGSAAEVYARQHYSLIGWRNNVCGYRRFFSITSLAGLRQEDPAVFAASHGEVARWFDQGLVDGLRIDHPDGLTDPADYLQRLRELVGPAAWIVIEKILAPDEALDTALPVDGATGYDALREVGGVFIDPAAEPELTGLYGQDGDYEAQVAELKTRAATVTLASELARVHRTIVAETGSDHPQLPEAVTALLTHIGVYRFDYPALAALGPVAVGQTIAARPDLAAPLQIISAALAGAGESAKRIQQLCGAVTAKAVEDCQFYRDARLVTLNEVGGEPDFFGVSAAEFHTRAAARARLWPHAMVTTSTHDTKRSEDVRARIGVLSQVPALWADRIARWSQVVIPPDPGTGLFLWQNIFGVWPTDGEVSDELRTRLHDYAEKAIREAAVHTTWNDPDSEFERAVHDWLDAVLDGPVATELTALVGQLHPHGHNDAVGQKLLALTVPGVPDVYQGTELLDDSLVDPDNRRPVNYAARRAALAELSDPKMRVVHGALRSRRERPETYLSGGYRALLADGSAADHVVAFGRGDDVVVAVRRWTARLEEIGWEETRLTLPEGQWVDRLTGRGFTGAVNAADLFAELPGVLLERA